MKINKPKNCTDKLYSVRCVDILYIMPILANLRLSGFFNEFITLKYWVKLNFYRRNQLFYLCTLALRYSDKSVPKFFL